MCSALGSPRWIYELVLGLIYRCCSALFTAHLLLEFGLVTHRCRLACNVCACVCVRARVTEWFEVKTVPAAREITQSLQEKIQMIFPSLVLSSSCLSLPIITLVSLTLNPLETNGSAASLSQIQGEKADIRHQSGTSQYLTRLCFLLGRGECFCESPSCVCFTD